MCVALVTRLDHEYLLPKGDNELMVQFILCFNALVVEPFNTNKTCLIFNVKLVTQNSLPCSYMFINFTFKVLWFVA